MLNISNSNILYNSYKVESCKLRVLLGDNK